MIPIDAPRRTLLMQRTNRLARAWAITRRDGVVHRFCDCDRDLDVDIGDGSGTQTYDASLALDVSAVELVEGLEPTNQDARGAIDVAGVTFEDLLHGRLDDAVVMEALVNHRYPWVGPLAVRTFYVSRVRYTGESWEVGMEGASYKLRPKLGEWYSRTCPYTLGSPVDPAGGRGCGVNLSSFVTPYTLTVESVAAPSYNARDKFKSEHFLHALLISSGIFTTNGRGWSDLGLCRWRSGANAGTESEVLTEVHPGGIDIEITLAEPTRRDIAVGDTFELVAGCDKLVNTCRDKFRNYAGSPPDVANGLRFGGFPHMPDRSASQRVGFEVAGR